MRSSTLISIRPLPTTAIPIELGPLSRLRLFPRVIRPRSTASKEGVEIRRPRDVTDLAATTACGPSSQHYWRQLHRSHGSEMDSTGRKGLPDEVVPGGSTWTSSMEGHDRERATARRRDLPTAVLPLCHQIPDVKPTGYEPSNANANVRIPTAADAAKLPTRPRALPTHPWRNRDEATTGPAQSPATTFTRTQLQPTKKTQGRDPLLISHPLPACVPEIRFPRCRVQTNQRHQAIPRLRLAGVPASASGTSALDSEDVPEGARNDERTRPDRGDGTSRCRPRRPMPPSAVHLLRPVLFGVWPAPAG